MAKESVCAISTNNDTKKLYTTNKILNKADTLKRIKKLTKLVADLENELKLAEYDYYRIVAEYLIEVKENLVYFDSFIAIPHIILIKNKVRFFVLTYLLIYLLTHSFRLLQSSSRLDVKFYGVSEKLVRSSTAILTQTPTLLRLKHR